ncbi:MAG: alpha/beta fold hydrolase [Gemmataceae bacterium]|nr:alpha/beta fold hydrolase [Gemmataceae bacterium]
MADGLLLLHAFPLDRSMWEGQVREFGDRLPVVAPDFPGLGSAAGQGGASMDSAADAAFAAMQEAGVDRAVVCGLSMGGYVALAFWRRHPEAVAGLVLANTRSGADDDAGKQRRRDLAQRLRAEGNGFLADNPPPLLSATAPGELMTRVKGMIGSQPAEGIAGAAVAMAERRDATPDLAGITVPALIVTGDGDTLIPPDASRPMAGLIPNARYEVIERSGHLSNMEAPEQFNALLREHLVRCGVLTA